MGTVTAATPFEELVAARVPGLLRLAVMLTGNAADAEDLVQAALARAVPHAARIAAMAAPAAYLRQVLVHEHVSRARRRRVVVVPLNHHDAPTADPADAVASSDRTWRVLATLPPRQRAVLVLRIYEDLPDRDIADLLGTTEATVRSNAARALDTLRSRLTRADLEEPR
jgi:RNA polymerase sigma-70 factor (sigma-E family)